LPADIIPKGQQIKGDLLISGKQSLLLFVFGIVLAFETLNDGISRAFFSDDDPNTTGDPQLCQNNQVGDFPMEFIENGNIGLRP